MKFGFDKDNGSIYYDDGDTQYFIKTDAKTHKAAWKQTSRMIRERNRPVPCLRLLTSHDTIEQKG